MGTTGEMGMRARASPVGGVVLFFFVAVATAESQDRSPSWDLLQPLLDIGVGLAEELEVQGRSVDQNVHELRWKVRRLNAPLSP
jgi:hypothetical protein